MADLTELADVIIKGDQNGAVELTKSAIEDGCVASRSKLHEAAVKIWAYRAFVRTTDQVINDYPW